MLKTKVKEETQSTIKFPCIRRTDEGLFVLFTDTVKGCGVGTVVSSANGLQPVGYHSKVWTMSEFKPFVGSITLQSE